MNRSYWGQDAWNPRFVQHCGSVCKLYIQSGKDRRVVSCDPYDKVYAEVPICVKPCQMTRGMFLAGTGLILKQSCSTVKFWLLDCGFSIICLKNSVKQDVSSESSYLNIYAKFVSPFVNLDKDFSLPSSNNNSSSSSTDNNAVLYFVSKDNSFWGRGFSTGFFGRLSLW